MPPLTEASVPLAVFEEPPLTDEVTPAAVLPAPPDTDEPVAAAVLCSPPLTDAVVPLAVLWSPPPMLAFVAVPPTLLWPPPLMLWPASEFVVQVPTTAPPALLHWPPRPWSYARRVAHGGGRTLKERAGLAGLRWHYRLWRDLGRLAPLDSPLAPGYERWRELKLALDPFYERYVAEVSARNWAASLETSALLWHLCRTLEVRDVLEFGSGFSSYVFRRYAAEADCAVRIVSADHDPDWLSKTEAFLDRQGSGSEGLVYLPDLHEAIGDTRFSLVFNDVLGELRGALMGEAVRRRAESGVVVADDANRTEDRRALMKAARACGLQMYDLRPWTTDFLGRWAILAM